MDQRILPANSADVTLSLGVASRSTGAPPPGPGFGPRRTGRFGLGMLFGLVAGLVLFAGGGYLVAVKMVGGSPSAVSETAAPAADPSAGQDPAAASSPGLYEQTQVNLNRSKFYGNLAQFAEPWLSQVSGCTKSSDPGPSVGKVRGNYVEYAFTSTAADTEGRTVAGIWWDNADLPVAGYVLAYWKEGLGENWAPLRDLWRRYS